MRTHVDLFSGIGGFALAAQANDVQTVSFCEIDERCRDFLAKAWPGVDIHDDVRSFDGLRYRDATWLLTAGVPCQPASRAGKQRGSDDDRWLWPEAIRVLSAVRPTWALFENPPGIGDVGLAGVLSDVEGEGYEVRVFSIPACAVGAPHRRERYWIVAHARRVGSRQDEPQREPDRRTTDRRDSARNSGVAQGDADKDNGQWRQNNGRQQRASKPKLSGSQDIMADAKGITGERWTGPIHQGQARQRRHSDTYSTGLWTDAVWVPCADGKFRRAPDDTIGLVDGLHRSLLAALGNSIVPQVAERIIAAMIEAEA